MNGEECIGNVDALTRVFFVDLQAIDEIGWTMWQWKLFCLNGFG